MRSSLYVQVARRLIIVVSLSALLIGVLVYYWEMHQVDREVLRLALIESRVINEHHADRILTMDSTLYDTLAPLVEAMVADQFLLVDIYDLNGAHIATAERPGDKSVRALIEPRQHRFPLDGSLHFQRFRLQQRLFIQVLLPLRGTRGEMAGYIEGVYEVEALTRDRLIGQVWHSVALVFAVSVILALAFYPVVINFNRRLHRYSRDLLDSNVQLMQVLGNAVAARDDVTNSHNYRVTLSAIRLAQSVGLEKDQIRDLIAGAFLHDVGKIGVPDAVLRKPGSLDADEISQMRRHVDLGLAIIDQSSWLAGAKDVIECHHERFDGSGYPQGLRGEQIPVTARIFAVVDVFDALITRRPYKQAMSFDQTMAQLAAGRGSHFDPRILDLFTRIAESLYHEYQQADLADLEQTLAASIRQYFVVRV